MNRKAIQLANNTLVISLPAKWVHANKVMKGDDLSIDETNGNLIVSSKKAAEGGEITIDASNMHPMIKRALGAAYKSGYNTVKVTFSTIDELKTIQEVVREEFLGFEIIEQKKNWLIFKKITTIDPQEFNTMLRRMSLIILSMGEDSLEAAKKADKEWLEAIILHDKDVNKIADFCRRLINITDIEGYKRNAPLYFIVEQLEKIGDLYRDICKHQITRGTKMTPATETIYLKTNNFVRQFYDLLFDFELKKMPELANKRKELGNICDKTFDNPKSADLKMISFLNRIAESTFDMNGPLMSAKL